MTDTRQFVEKVNHGLKRARAFAGSAINHNHTVSNHASLSSDGSHNTFITSSRSKRKRALSKIGLGRGQKRALMTTNPSHILIARGSRGYNPSAALSSPTETHAAASGIFRNHAQPSNQNQAAGSNVSSNSGHTHSRSVGTSTSQWVIDESDANAGDEDEDASEIGKLEDVQIDPTFTRGGRFPGTVKIIVEGTTFWAHRDILVFASPFFEAALSGDWSETRVDDQSIVSSRRRSVASVITIPQPPSNPSDRASREMPTNIAPSSSFGSTDTLSHSGLSGPPAETSVNTEADTDEDVDTDLEEYVEDIDEKDDLGGLTGLSDAEERDKVRDMSLSQLEGRGFCGSQRTLRSTNRSSAIAKVVLREEKAVIFHDFLKFVYPHLDCSITWNNVEGLMNISSKLCVPALTKHCLTFLLTHAAGKPIKAMRIAELFEEEHLFRESSRFVLDNPGGWSENELNTLSQDTLLKLEKRRNWFLERILKLGVTNIAKDYQCCATCPDPPTCARLLDEKWRQAYNACFRFGPCQPSIVYRYLRGLEGVTPPLALTHLACQTHAKAFTTSLFDRMFSLGVRGSGSGADPAPLAARVPGVQGPGAGPRRHFLYCSLKP